MNIELCPCHFREQQEVYFVANAITTEVGLGAHTVPSPRIGLEDSLSVIVEYK